MNEYDSGKIIDVLQSKEKIELIDKPADADIVILNTCSIREKAEEKVFHELGRIRKSVSYTHLTLPTIITV